MRPRQPQARPWRPSERTHAAGIVVQTSVISLGGRPALLFMTHPVCRSLCTKSTQITICRVSHELDPEALARARPVYQRSLASSQKGQISLRCCCQNSFCSPPPAPPKKPPRVSSLSTHAHASRGAHSITPLASLPQRIGDLWGLAGFVKRWLPSGVVTATFVFQGSSQWCEEKKKRKAR